MLHKYRNESIDLQDISTDWFLYQWKFAVKLIRNQEDVNKMISWKF